MASGREVNLETAKQTPRDEVASLRLLVVVDGSVASHPLPDAGEFELGRAPECDIQIVCASVSRRHARLRIGESCVLEDLGSANGTRVRGQSLSPGQTVPVAVGEAVELGDAMVLVQSTAAGPSASASATRGEGSPSLSAPFAWAPEVVVADDKMVELYELVKRVAAGSISILVLGESGAGKEIVARAVHEASPRAGKPLVSLNCAALSETLLESELFGHERGAFTGAVKAKPGLLETARGGTVFLDELGELPLGTQAKLLRVIEEQKVMRVGALSPRDIDVRFVAATNRDPEREVTEGRFRSDLYFRLNGVVLNVPPLRERPSELEQLAVVFAASAAEQLGMGASPTLATETLERLREYRWPGNIRELRNAMNRAVLLARAGKVLPEHLPAALASAASLSGADEMQSHARSPLPAHGGSGRRGKRDRAEVLAALDQTGWNQAQAAEVLGISRRTMLTWLDALDIQRPRKRRQQ